MLRASDPPNIIFTPCGTQKNHQRKKKVERACMKRETTRDASTQQDRSQPPLQAIAKSKIGAVAQGGACPLMYSAVPDWLRPPPAAAACAATCRVPPAHWPCARTRPRPRRDSILSTLCARYVDRRRSLPARAPDPLALARRSGTTPVFSFFFSILSVIASAPGSVAATMRAHFLRYGARLVPVATPLLYGSSTTASASPRRPPAVM